MVNAENSDKASSAREDEVLRRMLNTPPKPHKVATAKTKKSGGDTRRPSVKQAT